MYTFVMYPASESWTLARMLPLLVGDLVPDDDPHWLNFLLLLSIIDIIMAPKTTRALAAYLRELILQHHTAFKELYPERPITPKMHYIIHIPQWMIRWGYLHTIDQFAPPSYIKYNKPSVQSIFDVRKLCLNQSLTSCVYFSSGRTLIVTHRLLIV